MLLFWFLGWTPEVLQSLGMDYRSIFPHLDLQRHLSTNPKNRYFSPAGTWIGGQTLHDPIPKRLFGFVLFHVQSPTLQPPLSPPPSLSARPAQVRKLYSAGLRTKFVPSNQAFVARTAAWVARRALRSVDVCCAPSLWGEQVQYSGSVKYARGR